MRRQQRLLEKKKELINTDHEQLQERILQFNTERVMFEELAAKIQDTSERLSEEREKVLEQKAVFDEEKETLDRFKHDIDVERSILQSEFLKAEELEHELTHRENMLKMLQFNQDRQEKGIINIPSYTSCPGLKHGAQQPHTFNVQSNEQIFEQQQESPQHQFHYVKKFDYNQYMFELQNKLGDQTLFSS